MREGTRRFRRILWSTSRSRAATLVEVLIVVAIMGLISSGATLLVIPEFKKARIKSAIMGASVIRTAALTYVEIDMLGTTTCPSLQDLVEAKKIDGKRIEDPWGVPYEVECEDGEIYVVSAGQDRRFDTPDDIWDDFKPTDADRLSKL